VILAGGKGERFWPYSNARHPKQLLPLVSRKSMLEDTIANIRAFSKKAPIRLVIGKNLEKPVRGKVKGIKNVATIAEPRGRNTAAAVALAARLIQREDPRGVMLVLTADHAITPASEFSRAMAAAVETAEQGDCLVTFGIRPDRPETGFGYIESGGENGRAQNLEVHQVARFHEKPTEQAARGYVASGRFFWNSGMFAWRVDYLWEQFRRHLPATARAFEAAGDLNPRSASFAGKLRRIYQSIPDISIDYGILEKSDSIRAVIPAFRWDDIGAWSAWDRLHAADAAGNRILGQAQLLDSMETTCFADDGLICAYGVKNLLIVRHGGVTLVADKNKAPGLKELVKKVQENPKWRKYL
jgi:mannose-1-phosphate guanylyltransferase